MAISVLMKEKKPTKQQRAILLRYLQGSAKAAEVAKAFNTDHQRIHTIVSLLVRRAVQEGKIEAENLLP